jgi:hypothetical protein
MPHNRLPKLQVLVGAEEPAGVLVLQLDLPTQTAAAAATAAAVSKQQRRQACKPPTLHPTLCDQLVPPPAAATAALALSFTVTFLSAGHTV